MSTVLPLKEQLKRTVSELDNEIGEYWERAQVECHEGNAAAAEHSLMCLAEFAIANARALRESQDLARKAAAGVAA